MIRTVFLLSAVASLHLLASGCPLTKYASCEKDDDCKGRGSDVDGGGALVCNNHRCVECHYDGDCPEGKVCNTNRNTCDSIDSRTPEPDQGPPPANLEECAKRCKGDPTCGDSCREQFKSKP
jgi:Cys-rich repeat protein